MPTEMELTLELTQHGVSYKVSAETRNTKLLSDIEDSHGPSDAMHNPPSHNRSLNDSCGHFSWRLHAKQLLIDFSLQMEILLEPTSNKLMVGDLCDSIRIKLVTTGKKRWCDSIRIKLVPDAPVMRTASAAAKPCHGDSSELYMITGSIYTDQRTPDDCIKVKEVQRSFRHFDTKRLSRSDKVLKLKNFKKDATLKLYKSRNQERYEHVGLKVISSQEGKVYKMAKRDYAWLMISRCSRSHSKQAKEKAQDLKSMITTSNHKLMNKVK
ncbi:hypothetical protein Tco_1264288 [Tanacetum coccineum]